MIVPKTALIATTISEATTVSSSDRDRLRRRDLMPEGRETRLRTPGSSDAASGSRTITLR